MPISSAIMPRGRAETTMNGNGVKRATNAAIVAALLAVGSAGFAAAQSASPADAQIQADVMKALSNKHFANVKVDVSGGMVTLTGTVDVYSEKEDADKKAHHRKNVAGVRNEITVAGPTVEDSTLRDKIGEKIAYDRVGYGTTAFNAITIGVQNGVVTLGGVAYGPMDKDSALSEAANYPGVKDVVDNIEVAPPSPMDDRIRIATARAVYGYPSLNKYSIDPAKPIRITVVSGNVTLSGVVDSKADKDTAGIRANSVPGVFKVTNNLQVEGSSNSASK
ncbi:osmotically-inducible protein OsmY [Granulicella aggregans]|uniref:Osmotically-inducible protein OsmY n=2 Tax=Granulicella aggregans TaxID=474949 RepID=A0A7W8E1C3_9BACT|nr:osmotically-inducible protein OsmY [Granulicella aggregans]